MANEIPTSAPVALAAASFAPNNRFVFPKCRSAWYHRVVFTNPDGTALSLQVSGDAGATWHTITSDVGLSGAFTESAPAPNGGLTGLHAVDPTNVTGIYYSIDARWPGSPGGAG